jgi:hypothetical protein
LVGVLLRPRHVAPDRADGLVICAHWDRHRAAAQGEHRQHRQH